MAALCLHVENSVTSVCRHTHTITHLEPAAFYLNPLLLVLSVFVLSALNSVCAVMQIVQTLQRLQHVIWILLNYDLN